MRKFRLYCLECGSSENTEIIPVSSDGYWDDGPAIQCKCGQYEDISTEEKDDE